MTQAELEQMANSPNPHGAIAVHTFDQFREIGYEATQKWIAEQLREQMILQYPIIHEYLTHRHTEYKRFEAYKEELFELAMKVDPAIFESWVYQMKDKGFDKNSIYQIMGELFVYIQFHPITKDDHTYHDLVADFLDRFTYLGKGYRILPEEPDCA